MRPSFKKLAVLLAAGCAPNPTAAPDVQETSSTELRSSRAITGVRSRRNVVAGASVGSTPDSFAGWDLSALDRSGRGFAASFPSTGTFTIAGPRGRSFLRTANASLGFPRFFDTTERELDLSEYFLGRTNAVAASAGTSLAVSLGGLAPYTPGDDFQLTSAGAGLGFGSFLSVASTTPAPGATTLSADVAFADLTAGGNGGLIDAAQGDVAFVAQLVSNPVAGDVLYSNSLSRAATVSSLSMVDGASTPLIATLQPVAQTGHFVSTLRRSAFEAIAAQINPSAQVIAFDFGIDVAPAGLAHGSISGTPDLAYMGLAPGAGDPSITLDYANPYPSSWGAFGFHLATYQVDLSVVTPGGTFPYTTFVRSIINQPLPAFGANGIAPQISPVRNATLESAPLFASSRPATLTPELRWDAPSLGHPSFYTVTVTELSVANGSVSGQRIAAISTRERRLTVPVGVLSAQGRYTFTITAVASPGTEIDERPFQRHYPLFSADSVSGVIAPAGH